MSYCFPYHPLNFSTPLLQLGNGNDVNIYSFAPILTDRTIVRIAAGSSHAICIDKEGLCWGFGQSAPILSHPLPPLPFFSISLTLFPPTMLSLFRHSSCTSPFFLSPFLSCLWHILCLPHWILHFNDILIIMPFLALAVTLPPLPLSFLFVSSINQLWSYPPSESRALSKGCAN